MFETVAPETFEARSRKVLYETLPLSIAIHVVAIAGFGIGALWEVVFPTESPRTVRAYNIVSLPDPPPPPPPPQPPPKQAVVAPPPAEIVAPTVIPEAVPLIPDPTPPAAALLTPALPPTDTALPGSAMDGKIGGEVGGKLHGVGAQFFPHDGRVHIERNQSLPLQVISQEYPVYPDKARKAQLEDQVIVRYIIGKKGLVIDVQIIDHAKNAMFDEATVEAIKQWRFRPMIQDGKAVEVVHELAVNFELIRH